MQLCLVNNDPTSTILITPDGEPLFSIETPVLHHVDALTPSPRRQKSPITTIKRIERYHRSTGLVETEIGVVEYCGPEKGTHLQLCVENHALAISASAVLPLGIAEQSHSGEIEEQNANFWEFTGPDSKRYRWQIFVQSPVLLLADNSFTPLARYRRAKLGIVSRSRRAFLEILPAGINLIDLIVVTFVGFMRQRVIGNGTSSSHLQDTSDTNSSSSTRSTSTNPPPPGLGTSRPQRNRTIPQ